MLSKLRSEQHLTLWERRSGYYELVQVLITAPVVCQLWLHCARPRTDWDATTRK